MNRQYWDNRYTAGRGSGPGSRGKAAKRKARWLNRLVTERAITSVVDWGVGDGEVLSRLTLNNVGYVGIDVSAVAIRLCLERFPDRTFIRMDDGAQVSVRGDMAMSLDVVQHFPHGGLRQHLGQVFNSAVRFVAVWGTDVDDEELHAAHVRPRRWTPWVAESQAGWSLRQSPTDPASPGFYLYQR